LNIACGSSATSKIFILPFAEVPQGAKFLFYCLRNFRKPQKFCFTLCGVSAGTYFFVLEVAELPQVSKYIFSRLLRLSKLQNIYLVVNSG
jgi:hypothetical protein